MCWFMVSTCSISSLCYRNWSSLNMIEEYFLVCLLEKRTLISYNTVKCSSKWIFRWIFTPVHSYMGMKTCVQSHIPSIDVKIVCFKSQHLSVYNMYCMKLFSAINRNCLTQASVIVLYNTGLILRLRSGLLWLFERFSFSDQIRTYRDQPWYILTEKIIIMIMILCCAVW